MGSSTNIDQCVGHYIAYTNGRSSQIYLVPSACGNAKCLSKYVPITVRCYISRSAMLIWAYIYVMSPCMPLTVLDFEIKLCCSLELQQLKASSKLFNDASLYFHVMHLIGPIRA